MSKDIVHLVSGLMIHGKDQAWCRAPLKVVGGKMNATDKRERCTCETCIDKHNEAVAEAAKHTKVKT